MSEPTDNHKRAERLAKQNARTQARLENRSIALERREQAQQIVEESSGKKEHAIAVYNIQLQSAIMKQKRIEEQYLKQIQDLETKFCEIEDEIENKRDASLKKIDEQRAIAQKKLDDQFDEEEKKQNERLDAKLQDTKKMYEDRIKRIKDRLKENETRPQVENMKLIIENTKNLQTFKKPTVAEVVRELEKKDTDEALKLVPEIRQNEIIQSNEKQNKRMLEEASISQFLCEGCQKKGDPNYNHIFEDPAFTDGNGRHYCKVCVQDGIPI
jgi:hypothetical protein